MTAPTDHAPDAVTAPSKVEATATVDDPKPTRHRPAHRKPHQWWWRVGFPISLVVLLVSIPVLVWVGARVVLDSNDGRIVSTITDPAAPGFEATVDPTPVMAVALTDPDGDLDSVALLALTGEGSGSVVVLSANTLMVVPGIGSIPLGTGYGSGGVDVLRDGLQGMLGLGVAELEVVEAAEWSALVGPAGPLTVDNPDRVDATDASGDAVTFAQGEISVPPSQAWAYLSARNAGESELNRLVRMEAFWQAWISAVTAAGDGPGVVPGETESGLGRFVRTLATGTLDTATLPVRAIELDEVDEPAYEPLKGELQALVARIAPFPAGPEGTRAHMTVLDGTGSLDHGLDAAVLFAANGGQVDKVGNAPEFGVTTTQFIYYDDAARNRVERMREAAGVGELVKSDELNVAVDITVVLGEDFPKEVGG